jgi:hypothetical protein
MSELIKIRTPEQLVEVLRARPERDAYEGADRNYYVTYQGGTISRAIIDEAEERGLIKRRYPDKTLNVWSLA